MVTNLEISNNSFIATYETGKKQLLYFGEFTDKSVSILKGKKKYAQVVISDVAAMLHIANQPLICPTCGRDIR